MLNEEISKVYIDILKEELVPAMGCTEPVAVAFAGALARKTLGKQPEAVRLTVSGNIIKNVKSVIVPHTGGRRELHTAVAAGICCGNPDRKLEVISEADDEQIGLIDKFLDSAEISVAKSDANNSFDIQVAVYEGNNSAYVRIIGNHTNVVYIKKTMQCCLISPFRMM